MWNIKYQKCLIFNRQKNVQCCKIWCVCFWEEVLSTARDAINITYNNNNNKEAQMTYLTGFWNLLTEQFNLDWPKICSYSYRLEKKKTNSVFFIFQCKDLFYFWWYKKKRNYVIWNYQILFTIQKARIWLFWYILI